MPVTMEKEGRQMDFVVCAMNGTFEIPFPQHNKSASTNKHKNVFRALV